MQSLLHTGTPWLRNRMSSAHWPIPSLLLNAPGEIFREFCPALLPSQRIFLSPYGPIRHTSKDGPSGSISFHGLPESVTNGRAMGAAGKTRPTWEWGGAEEIAVISNGWTRVLPPLRRIFHTTNGIKSPDPG